MNFLATTIIVINIALGIVRLLEKEDIISWCNTSEGEKDFVESKMVSRDSFLKKNRL